MRYSKLFGKTSREVPREEESINADLLTRAGFVDKVMAGVYTFLPLGFRVFKKVESIIREEMNAIDGQEMLMPTLQPKANWLQTNRWETLDTLFKFTSFYSKTDYVLGPTHEEIITPLSKKFIFSYKDLPLAVYHIQNKFRDEKRPKSGLLRGREFYMKDLYSFHTNENDFEEYYARAQEAYKKVFKKVGLGDITYMTFASGGTFSKFSHEFQTLSKTGEDTIYVCEKCKIAVNKEIMEEQKVCPSCSGSDFKEEKAIEVGNIFPLKTKFSDAFGFVYKDKNGETKPVIMGCYGIGLNRLVGTIAEVCSDEKGLIWPESIAPYKVYLIALGEKGKEMGEKIYKELCDKNIEVLYDDREDKSAGEKFADSDLIGLPYRFVVSDKTGDKIEVKKRTDDKLEIMDLSEALKLV